MNEAIHQDWPSGGEVKAAHGAKAFEPGRTHVVKAAASGVEEVKHLPFVIFVENRRQLVIDSIHVILVMIVGDVPAPRLAVGIEHSEVTVKAAVLLLQEDHVIHRGNAARSWSWRGCWRRRGSRR